MSSPTPNPGPTPPPSPPGIGTLDIPTQVPAGEAGNPAVIAAATGTAAADGSAPAPLDLSAIEAAIAAAGAGGTVALDPTLKAAYKAYFSVWGVAPPGWDKPDHGYIGKLVDGGMNATEILANELAKPEARKTHYYRDATASYASEIAQLMGRR